MAEDKSIWVGRDEHHGVRAQQRKDLKPPPHWRLEAVAATPRPRSLTLGADRRRAVFIEDAETSDVWLLDLEGGPAQRLTTGRDPAPYWEDTEPRLSPDGPRSPTSTAATSGSSRPPAVPRASSSRAARPVWVDDATLVIVRRARRHHAAGRGRQRRRLAPAPGQRHGDLDERGDEGEPAVSPDRTRGGLHLHAARRPQPQRDPRGRPGDRRGARADRHAPHARPLRRRGRPTAPRSPTRRSAAASTSCTWSAATAPASVS